MVTNTTRDRPSKTPDASRRRLRRPRLAGAAVLAAAALATAALVGPPSAVASDDEQTVEQPTTRGRGEVQRTVDTLVDRDGYPGVLAAVQDESGRQRSRVAGVGDLSDGSRVPRDGAVRIGSNTKTFTAVVVLQLVGEKRIGLDEPIETYLPGLVRGEGIDGRNITVRQVLQHTSGLPNYTGFLVDGLLPYQHSYKQPRELLDLGLAEPAVFAPGNGWDYSNTNYVVAGLLVEAVTDRPVREEITERVIDRIGLRHTYFPNVGDESVRGRHPRAYHRDDPAQPLVDVTEQDPSFGWAAGQMIATPTDVNRFFTALLRGELLEPAQLAQMRETVPAEAFGEGAGYGLGLIGTPLDCGGTSWGHGGSITGYSTTNAATDDGRAATIATTSLPTTPEQVAALQQAVDDALCG